MTNHERIKLAFAGVKASEGFADRVLRNAEAGSYAPTQRSVLLHKRGFAIAATIIILAALTTSALAYARILDFSKIYAAVFGEKSDYIEQYIEPFVSESASATGVTENHAIVQPQPGQDEPEPIAPVTERPVIECEFDGIILTLVSAINDGDVLRIFATIQDTTGDRINDSIRFDDWILSQGSGGNISVVDYDRATRTATLLITSLGGGHEGSATLSINGFTTNREIILGLIENGVRVYDILPGHTPQTISLDKVWVTGGAERDPNGELLSAYSSVLRPDETDIRFENVSWTFISNLGFIDGVLHVQTAQLSEVENQLLSISFVTAENEVVYEGNRFLGFIDGDQIYNDYYHEQYARYRETIYEDITDIEQLSGLIMAIDFVEMGSVNEGRWEFSFVIPERVTTGFEIGREITINGSPVYLETGSISPLGVIIDLPDNIVRNYMHEDCAYVIYRDGTVIELNETYIDGNNNESTLKFGGSIVEIEQVQTIVINGEYFPFQQR